MKTTEEKRLAYIRGPLRAAHRLSSAATRWVALQEGLVTLDRKVAEWLSAGGGPSAKARVALDALRATSATDIDAALARQREAAKVRAEAERLVAEARGEWADLSAREKAQAWRLAAAIDRAEREGRTKTGMDTVL